MTDKAVISMTRRHQTKLAQLSLRMSPEAARELGGMNFPEAYKYVFGMDLRERLNELIARYGKGEVTSELGIYGWETVEQFRDLLKRIEPDCKETV